LWFVVQVELDHHHAAGEHRGIGYYHRGFE
jgi:hypothetical protein